ncbi:pheromone receptor, partial [Fistulina hepatica ATCC 64428]
MSTDPTYPLFPVFAFIGMVLVLLPLPWHLRAWNAGTCYFMLWASLACLNQFVNSIVWAGNVFNPAPWWCEISIRVIFGVSVGIPASSFCIVRRLYHISRTRTVAISPAEKRRSIIIDSAICVVLPLAYIALQYVVQGHRYNIFEDVGCEPAVVNTLATYFISYAAPLAFGLSSAVYCALSLQAFNARRIQFRQFAAAAPCRATGFGFSQYVRLMALAMTEMACTTPLNIFIVVLNATATGGLSPYVSWANIHWGYSHVELYPAILWRADHRVAVGVELTRWLAPVCALIFFAYFGFTSEARRNYK